MSMTKADVYRETMETIRYYGTVRYILFPVYLSATAVLVSQIYKCDNFIPQSQLIGAGLAIAIIFLIFEASLLEFVCSLERSKKIHR
jgi:hypothetical protein